MRATAIRAEHSSPRATNRDVLVKTVYLYLFGGAILGYIVVVIPNTRLIRNYLST